VGGQKFADIDAGLQARDPAPPDLDRFVDKFPGVTMTATAFGIEPRRGIGLGQQHSSKRFDFVVGNVVVVHEQVQVVNVVAPLQLSIDIPQELARKPRGFTVTFFAAAVPDSGRIARTRFYRDKRQQ